MVSKLREKEPFIANGIIRILRNWKEAAYPRPFILQEEDIEQLAEWADKLHKSWDWMHDFNIEHGISTEIIPEPIYRRRR